MNTFQFDSLPLALLLWLIIYPLDYFLTIYSSRLWYTYAKVHLEFEGSYELNLYYRADVDARKKVSNRFLLIFILGGAWLAIMWWASHWLNLPQFFGACAGFLLLMELVVISGHVQNIILFRAIKESVGALEGHVRYARWLSVDITAWKFGYWALVFLLLTFLTASWFFGGGVVSCLNIFIRYHRFSQRLRKQPTPPEATSS